MKRIITLAVAILALAVSGFAQETVKLNFNLGEFKGIDADFVHHVYVTEGRSNEIEVVCPKKYEENLEYKIYDGTLRLGINLPPLKQKGKKGIEEIVVKIQMTDIEKIKLSGAAKFTMQGDFRGESIYINLSGASECSFNGDYENAESKVSGAAKLNMKGNMETLSVCASGAAYSFFEGKADEIEVECSGAANIKLVGTTDEIEIEASGAAKVEADKMIAKDAKATASGASKILVYGSDKMELSSSAAAAIEYFGEAKDLRMSNPAISKGK